MTPHTILTFWFDELTPQQWFTKDPELDRTITERFKELHAHVAAGEYDEWVDTPEGALALVLTLDQFSRNMFRDTPEAFACDDAALRYAQAAIERGFDQQLPERQRSFLYMPYMHSESPVVHEEALRLFSALGNDENLKYELLHKHIIDRFGRYPHRNAILGRPSTPEEEAFLQSDEVSSF